MNGDENMLTLKTRAEASIEVKKSRFIAIALPTLTTEDIKEAVAKIRREHPDATHVVHAAVIGKKGDIFSYSDDREPKNTAGRPAFEVLKGSLITNITVCIVRYFGGTLLGTGGLVKAYQDSVRAVLPLLDTEELVDKEKIGIRYTYDYCTMVKRLLDKHGATVENEEFATDVKTVFTLPCSQANEIKGELTELTKGGITFI
jgi:uncharacterized protein, YigZ family